MKKATITIILSLVFFGIFLIYWKNNNAQDLITGIKNEMIQHNQKATGNSYDSSGVNIIATKINLAQNKYLSTDLKTLCNTFFVKWQASGKLSKADSISFSNSFNERFSLAAKAFQNRKDNQLVAVVLISLIFSIFWVVVLLTPILRDIVGDTTKIDNEKIHNINSGKQPDKVKPPFSLARTQLTVWIAIISSVYIYAVFWDNRSVGEINSTALILMGISAGTFAAGAILDTTEIQRNIPRCQDWPSKNFFEDILSDSNGISVHRFQNVVWTVVAIVIYFYRYGNPPANATDVLPVLDSTLLALTGISSATYLTLKAQENPPITNKKLKIKIQLVPGDSLTLDEKDKINKSEEGFRKAAIRIEAKTTGDSIPANLEKPDSKFDFVADSVESGKFQKITALWEGKLDNVSIKLSGSSNDIIKDDTKQPIIIKMEKTS